jgi:hypothetical protein
MGDREGLDVFPSHGVLKIQLWSDARGKEFAVRLSNDHDFKAVSNPAVDYTKLVEEADYFSDMDYDWSFLLEYWMGVKNGSIKLFDLNGKKEPRAPALDWTDMQSSPAKTDKKRVKREKPKPLLKCRYCMLSYNSEKERQEHELIWHSEKLQKDSNQTNAKPN